MMPNPLEMPLGYPGQRFTDNSVQLGEEELTGIRRDLAEAARTVLDTEAYAAMVRAIPTAPEYGLLIGLLCQPVGTLLLDGMPDSKAVAGVRARTVHAMRTRDARELQRITTLLAMKGTLA